MKKYYGLQLIRTFFLAASIVISIVTVASIGTLGAAAMLNEIAFDAIQALTVLISGGLIALLCYAFAQLIDLQLTNYSASAQIFKQMKEANEQNAVIADLLQKQLQIMRLQSNLPQDVDVDAIQKQLEERRKKLS